MALIYKTQKLSDAIIGNPSIITVLNRFDIFLGVGDKTVEQACNERKLNTEFFLTILNTFANEEYFPEELLKHFDVKLIIGYLDSTNSYYQQFIIPNIERHFNLLLRNSEDDNSNLELLRNFFLEAKSELLGRINNDKTVLFKEILSLNEASLRNIDSREINFDNDTTDSIEDKIDDLVNMFVIHLTGKYDTNLCLAVLSAVMSLKKDLCQNDRIRNRILMPILRYLNSQQANA